MSSIPLFVTIKKWTDPLLKEIHPYADGIVIGDLFCQKRMFENEWFDVIELATHAKELNLRVTFQTPVYNTSKTFDTMLCLLRKLYKKKIVDAIFVHDIGVLQALKELQGIELWWDNFAFNRDFVPNKDLIEFLKLQGISNIEVKTSSHIKEVSEQDCGIILFGYGPNITSFSRICYTEYFLDEPCERKLLCRNEHPFIVSVDKNPLQYIADGYTLIDRNTPIHFLPEIEPKLMRKVDAIRIYIENINDIQSVSAFIKTFDKQ